MKLVEAIGIRLQNLMDEKGFNCYRIGRKGGVNGTTVSDIIHAR